METSKVSAKNSAANAPGTTRPGSEKAGGPRYDPRYAQWHMGRLVASLTVMGALILTAWLLLN